MPLNSGSVNRLAQRYATKKRKPNKPSVNRDPKATGTKAGSAVRPGGYMR